MLGISILSDDALVLFAPLNFSGFHTFVYQFKHLVYYSEIKSNTKRKTQQYFSICRVFVY